MSLMSPNDGVISNRVVNVASGAPYGDATALTDGAGIVVADLVSIGTTDERSIMWRAGLSNGFLGVALSADGGASNQGCWDVSGGSLRITAAVPAGSNAYPPNSNGGHQPGYAVGRDVSYGLRVNNYDELELFKRVLPFSCNANAVPEQGASYRVVARFGGAAGPNAISLPTSMNPY